MGGGSAGTSSAAKNACDCGSQISTTETISIKTGTPIPIK